MIKLTIQSPSTQEVRFFDKSIVIIGSRLPEADICLSHPSLQPIHLKIVRENNVYILINVAHDPFVTVNGQTFEKIEIHSKDRIELNGMIILFEETDDVGIGKMESLTSDTLRSRLEQKMVRPTRSFEKEEEEEEWNTQNLEQLYTEFESDSEDEIPPIPDMPVETKKPLKKTSSIKDSHLSDSGDENESWRRQNKGAEHTSFSPERHNRQWIFLLIGIIFAAAGISGAMLYHNSNKNAAEEELHAARGLADVSMALTYAQLHDIKPHNKNWADHEFLKSNLNAVLTDPHRLASLIDIQNYFNKISYNLRIYTSSDLTRFLIIAQPISHWSYWIVSKNTLLVDSVSMEIRKVGDLRALNRLLAIADPLEKDDLGEISRLVKEEDPIPLMRLSEDSKAHDFTVPASLTKVNPGAENLIYNAPRYYRMGHSLIETTKKLLNSHEGKPEDVAFVKKETKALANLPNLILYVPHNQEVAEQIQQGLSVFCPEHSSIAFGWLSTDKKGDIVHCHALDSDKQTQIVFDASSLHPDKKTDSLDEDLDIINHPLYAKLTALKTSREQALGPVMEAIDTCLKKQIENPSNDFHDEYQELSKAFVQGDLNQTNEMKDALHNLYQEHDDLTYPHFMAIVKKVGFESIFQRTESFASRQKKFAYPIQKIAETNNLIELESWLEESRKRIASDRVPDPIALIAMRRALMDTLERLLLSSGHHVDKISLTTTEKTALEQILNQAWIVEPEERDYFVAEAK